MNSSSRQGVQTAPLGLAAIAAAATLWAVAATVAADLFADGVDPLELAQSRAYIACAGLALIPAAWRRVSSGARWWGPILLGASIGLVNAAYYVAIDHVPVAIAIVLQYTAPALVVLWIAATLRRAPEPDIVRSLIAALAGVVLVSGALSSGGDTSGLGIAMGLTAAFLFATYTLLSERVGAAYGILPALLRGFFWASVGWIVYQAPRGFPDALVSDRHLLAVLFVGLAGTLAPFLLFLWGVQQVRAERAAIAATLEPVIAAIVAWVWLSQELSALQIVGGVLVLAGVAGLQARRAEPVAPDV
jgi:DME family drug/metabolite transporter